MQLCESKAGASWTFGKTEEKCFPPFFPPNFQSLCKNPWLHVLKVSSLLNILILPAIGQLLRKDLCLTCQYVWQNMGEAPWSHWHPRKKQLLSQNSPSPFPHSILFLSAPTSPPSHSRPWCVLKQFLRDWRTLNLAAQPHQWQLENYFQNPQLGHLSLIGWAGSWKETERTNAGVFEVLSPWVDSGRTDGFARKE